MAVGLTWAFLTLDKLGLVAAFAAGVTLLAYGVLKPTLWVGRRQRVADLLRALALLLILLCEAITITGDEPAASTVFG